MQEQLYDRAGFVIALIFVAMAHFIGAWDLWVTIGPGKGARTVSDFVCEWCKSYPIITLVIGMVLGHLFFPFGGPK